MGAKNVVYSRNKHFSSACVPEDDSVAEEAKRDEDRACEDDKGRRLKPETRTTKSNKTTIRTNFGFLCILTFVTIFIVFCHFLHVKFHFGHKKWTSQKWCPFGRRTSP